MHLVRGLNRNNVVIGLVGCFIAFLIGRQFYATGNDFAVYHAAARSLIAGRTDLYSSTFALGPPMVYVYPPLYLLLVFPIGWLDGQNAFGLCFALMALALVAVARLVTREWRPSNPWIFGASIVLVTGPYATLCFRSGNVHLVIALLLVAGCVAWSRGRLWWAATAVALGGAIKIFPLFLLPVWAIRREWALLQRTLALTIVIWALPALYFGPAQTVNLYRSWITAIAGDFDAYKQQRAVDLSLPGVLGRWLAPVDYARYVDSGYPQVNVVTVSPQLAKGIGWGAVIFLSGLTLAMGLRLSRTPSGSSREIAAVAAIFVTAALLAGPYTPIQHLSAWIIVAMTLPVAVGNAGLARGLVVIGLINSLLFAIPGSGNQRALQAYGAFTFIGLALWGLSMFAARELTRNADARERDPAPALARETGLGHLGKR